MEFSYHHTGKYDIASDSFQGGKLRAYCIVPHPQIHGETRLIGVEADTVEELRAKWAALQKGQK